MSALDAMNASTVEIVRKSGGDQLVAAKVAALIAGATPRVVLYKTAIGSKDYVAYTAFVTLELIDGAVCVMGVDYHTTSKGRRSKATLEKLNGLSGDLIEQVQLFLEEQSHGM